MKKIISLIAAAALALGMTACGKDYTKEGGQITTADLAQFETITETAEVTEETEAETEASAAEETGPKVIADREGGVVQVPEEINTIVSTAPSITEILTGLGVSDKIIAADLYSADIEGIDPAICTIDFYNLNIETLAALAPDVIIISGMSASGADDPYAALKSAGMNVVYVPTSNSIEAVKLDIEFLAAYTGTEEKGAELMAEIDAAVADISAKTAEIDAKRKVYFEIGSLPNLYSCGSGTFIDELITLAGGENIYAAENGWLSNSEESVIAANPDVIITSVAYDGYDYNEIKARKGWSNINAVKTGAVYQVNSNAVSRPSQHIVEGMYEVAKAIYPEVFAE